MTIAIGQDQERGLFDLIDDWFFNPSEFVIEPCYSMPSPVPISS